MISFLVLVLFWFCFWFWFCFSFWFCFGFVSVSVSQFTPESAISQCRRRVSFSYQKRVSFSNQLSGSAFRRQISFPKKLPGRFFCQAFFRLHTGFLTARPVKSGIVMKSCLQRGIDDPHSSGTQLLHPHQALAADILVDGQAGSLAEFPAEMIL